VSSLHFSAFALGIILIGVGGNRIIRLFGRLHSLWIGAIGISVSACLLSYGKSPIVTIRATFLMGFIGSLILVIVPACLSEKHGEQRAIAISESNVISSLISSAAPLLVGWFVYQMGDWRWALGVVALTPLILYISIGRGVVLENKASDAGMEKGHHPLPFQFWIYWLAIVLAVSVEFCMISWSADYLENILGMLKANASQSVSLFLGGMILGRMSVSRLVRRFPALSLIKDAILLASGGFLLFWKSDTIQMGLIGLFISDFGVASMYPMYYLSLWVLREII
jgi:MFS family permease